MADEGVNSDWWDFRKWDEPAAYGSPETYELGMAWLDETCDTIADWGCGLTYAKRYVKRARYWGVDGSANNPFADELADLRKYRQESDGIFMRHVLEHNQEWADILDNALASFRKRYALILFTPFQETTRALTQHLTFDIGFRKEDLTERFGKLPWTEQSLATSTQFGAEHVFFIEKYPA